MRLRTKLRDEFSITNTAQHTWQIINPSQEIKSPKHRPPTQKEILRLEHKPRGCEKGNYTDEEDFDKTDPSGNESDFDKEEVRRRGTQRVYMPSRNGALAKKLLSCRHRR